MRSVVLFPQPEGPTSTMNSGTVMSRSIPWTAGVLSKVLTMLRSATCAMFLPLGRAGSQTGNVIVHQERIDDQGRGGPQQRPGHDLSPVIHVALDQCRHDAHRQHKLV